MASRTVVWATAGAAAYAVGSHLLMIHAADRPWAVAVLLAPLLLVAGPFAWRAGAAGRVALAAAILALAAVVACGGVGTVDTLYVLQHAGIHLALGVAFALTLRRPVSMIGRVAGRVHGLTPAVLAYTRKVTLAWTLYLFGMAAASVATWRFAPWAAWSLLANVVTPCAMAALFVGEHALRYRLHPEFERVSLRAGIQAWRSHAPLGPDGGVPR